MQTNESNDPYVNLNEEANRYDQKKRRTCCVVTTVLIIIGVIVAIIAVLALIGSQDSTSSNNSSNSYVNYDGLIMSDLGKIQGKVLKGDYPNNTNKWIYEFIGIQYAESPIDDMRFRPAVLKNTSWGNTTYNAKSYGDACPQDSSGIIYSSVGEDCLFLNIWTPYIPASSSVDSSDSDSDDNDLLPVMLFIHGGSFTSGAGSEYNGTEFIIKGGYNIIYVSINYRLGIFGYLQMTELFEEGTTNTYGYDWPSYGGMNGIYDQVQAIRWIKQEIKSYGGDPDRITIFGESAGGLSVCMLLVTPFLNDSTIYQSIVESGPCVGPWGAGSVSYGLYLNKLALESGSTYGNFYNLTKLRSLSWENLYNKVQASNTLTGGYWTPMQDMLVIPNNISTMYSNIITDEYTGLNAERVIWGFNSQDALAGWPFYTGTYPETKDEYIIFLNAYLNNDSTIVNEIMNVYYPLSDFYNNASIAWFGINSDMCIQCPQFEMNDNLNKLNNSIYKQYLYEFKGYYSPFLAPHASELIFVFDLGAYYAAYFKMRWNETLSQEMINAWNKFGRMTEGSETLEFHLVNYDDDTIGDNVLFEWIDYDTNTNKTTLIFDNDLVNIKDYRDTYRNGACNFWRDNVDYSLQKTLCLNALTPV